MVQEGTGVAIAMDIYEKLRYYRAHTDYSQRTVAKMLGISRNTVKKYWKGQAATRAAAWPPAYHTHTHCQAAFAA